MFHGYSPLPNITSRAGRRAPHQLELKALQEHQKMTFYKPLLQNEGSVSLKEAFCSLKGSSQACQSGSGDRGTPRHSGLGLQSHDQVPGASPHAVAPQTCRAALFTPQTTDEK